MSHTKPRTTRKRSPGKCWCRGRPNILADLNTSELENKQLRLLLRRACGVLRDLQRESAQVGSVIQEIEKVS